jgi:hypothetical protein
VEMEESIINFWESSFDPYVNKFFGCLRGIIRSAKKTELPYKSKYKATPYISKEKIGEKILKIECFEF